MCEHSMLRSSEWPLRIITLKITSCTFYAWTMGLGIGKYKHSNNRMLLPYLCLAIENYKPKNHIIYLLCLGRGPKT